MFNRENRFERGYQTVKVFCQNGMIIPAPPLRRGASEIERTFHKMKRDALVYKSAR